MSDFHLVDSQGWEYDLQSVRSHRIHVFNHVLTLQSIGVLCIYGIFSAERDTLASGNVHIYSKTDPLMPCTLE